MGILRWFAVLLVGTCSAQTPEFYNSVSRLTWVVENIDKVRPSLERLGLADIQESPNIQLVGTYRGKPVTIYAWQITGRLGNVTVDVIQPGEGQANAYTAFLSQHGDGILSLVHEVPNALALQSEIGRIKGKGCQVLQQVSMPRGPVFTYFDTEPEGKFVLGLVNGVHSRTEGAASHFGMVVWDAAAVSAYWQKLGLPRFTKSPYEWIAPLPSPANIYADFLNRHNREGIQHFGLATQTGVYVVGGVTVESEHR